VNALLAVPLAVRLGLLGLLGAAAGCVLNWAIYRLAFNPRPISPWGPAPPEAPPRTWQDRIPIIGWLVLRREAKFHQSGFWIRPLLIELLCALGLAWLYWWDTEVRAGYQQPPLVPNVPDSVLIPPSILHAQFIAHALLLALMVVASAIDMDEKLIPDAVTVNGSLLALVLAAVLPWSLLPQIDVQMQPGPFAEPLHGPQGPLGVRQAGRMLPVWLTFLKLTSPGDWPPVLGGAPHAGPLALGLGCYFFFWFAIIERPWYPRHGTRRAFQIASAHFLRALRRMGFVSWGIIAVGAAGLCGTWWWGGAHWAGLLSALIGMAVSGGLVWAVRIIGAVTLRREAMGFGDVLLMMMIGAFLGWQPCLLVFFVAPFFGLVIGLLQYLTRHDDSIPYGPFLCLGAVALLVFWADFWNWSRRVFALGWLLPAVIAVCLLAMAVLLAVLQVVKRLLGVVGREVE